MSKQVKKPAEQTPVKISNIKLLPNGLATEPNKKMLDSTLDVMTSKGQMLPFKETYGIRTANNKVNEFFKVESDQVRRESQGNNMLVLNDNEDNYLGKVAYYDIENYFRIKGNQLKDGVVLDKNINVLDLPVDSVKLTDYNLFYWLEDDLPLCRIHLNEASPGVNKFSILTDLLGKPFITLKDDITGNELELQNDMTVYFTGAIDANYKTNTDSSNNLTEDPKVFYVFGVGRSIGLFPKSQLKLRIPSIGLVKSPWDKYGKPLDYPSAAWDGSQWDTSEIKVTSPEYVVQRKYSSNNNHWQVLDRWYHIGTIRTVAKFLGVLVEDIITAENKAKRPIISYSASVQLYNWPTETVTEINSFLLGTKEFWTNKTDIVDQFGYTLQEGDKVVFGSTSNVWRVNNISTGAVFTLLPVQISNNFGAIIVSPGVSQFYQVIYKNNQWQLAQNKTTKNQTPLFEFYNSKKINLETFNFSSFKGGVILGFKEGAVFDSVLEKNVDVSIIESESGLIQVTPNQLNFVTDVDSSYEYTDLITNEQVTITDTYGYKSGNNIIPFYKNRSGLDFTKQIQDLLYEKTEDSEWSASIIPVTNGFTTIHIYYDNVDQFKFYFEVEGYGLIRFSGKTGIDTVEQVIPLISGGMMKIVCHDLPYPLKFYKTAVVNNITTIQEITSDYITNNNISNGTIELNLNDSISVNNTYIDNELSAENTKLIWKFNEEYKIAYVKSLYNWNFLQSVFTKDYTNILFNNYDYTLSDTVLQDGNLDYYKQITASIGINNKSQSGDKICVASVIDKPESKTAPLSLTVNPLNKQLTTLNYYSLYQHATAIKANAADIDKFFNNETLTNFMGGGTLLKHSDPLAKAAIVATNMPYDLGDLLIKQGKHYDIFLYKLKTELENVINTTDYKSYTSLEILNLALNNIYIAGNSNELFWSHSNMIGWDLTGDDYYQEEFTLTLPTTFNLVEPGGDDEVGPVGGGSGSGGSGSGGEGPEVGITSTISIDLEDSGFDYISHRTGKESILHIEYNGELLLRGYDYWFTSNNENDKYTKIEFRSFYNGKKVTITQWYTTFKSMVPASLAKIGLSPIYRPEILLGPDGSYRMYRHDGTRYILKEGVNSNGSPANLIDYYLYEYEKAVWSSIAYDIENNNQREILESQPGYFRNTSNTWNSSRQTIDNEVRQWMIENNIFIMKNDNYDSSNGFTLKYQLGTGDGKFLVGSFSAVYRYMYDTARPHSHPWEMLGYTIKPTWWDTYYSWTDSTKRIALKKALRLGNISNPAEDTVINPAFARNIDINHPNPNALEDFPVDLNGRLISPKDFDAALLANSVYLSLDVFDALTNWEAGDIGPYEQVFLNTHRGLAARTRALFLLAPAQYVNLNWVPGQIIKNAWGHTIDRTTGFWQQGSIAHNYHRESIDNQMVYTGGIESLYSEFCLLNNKDYVSEVINKFNNISVNKEFLLNGFTNKENIRIQSTSTSTQKNILFVPDENYQVRTVKHYPEREIFYSAMRIIFDGTHYSLNGFATEFGYFPSYSPKEGSSTSAISVGNVTVKEKNHYSDNINFIRYGKLFSNRQDIYDILIGYGKYLEDMGIVYEEPEGGDIRNWQLSAKQFIFWSNDKLAAGNFIDLNPCADFIKITGQYGQLENLEGTNENVGQCVDRFNKPLFSKDLLVTRDAENILIKTKKQDTGIYGIKLVFVNYESVVHLDSTSIFGDVYFDPSQNTSKRSFVTGGRKSTNWTGAYYVPGYVFDGTSLVPNFDSMSEVGRTLLDIESTVLDPTLLEASRAQFGLNRNIELRQLFLDDGNEILFKNAITFNKGTTQVFDSLNPLTHQDGSRTKAYDEYMVRLGEFGNTKNTEFYEFEMLSTDISNDSQLVKFTEKAGSDNVLYVTNNSSRWVYKPYNKFLNFAENNSHGKLKKSGPIINGDTDLIVDSLDDLVNLYDEFFDLWIIPAYSTDSTYKINEQIRYDGQLYLTVGAVAQNQMVTTANNFVIGDSYTILTLGTTDWNVVAGTTGKVYAVGDVVKVVPILQASSNNKHTGTGTAKNIKFSVIPNEPYLPNIFVNNYNKPNPGSQSPSGYTPGTWQVLQTTDVNLSIYEVCKGLTDVSKARVSTGTKNHNLAVGDYVCIVNADADISSVNGIWKVTQIEQAVIAGATTYYFYINTRITETIYTGKVFTFKPVRFKNEIDFNIAKASSSYSWRQKYETIMPLTPSGYDPRYPIAIVDNGEDNRNPVTFNYGNYKVYQIQDGNVGNPIPVKVQTDVLKMDDIEHLIVYDYATNKTVVKLELFSPQDLIIPSVFKNDIDIIGRVDPAKYNRTTDKFKSVYTSLGWYEEYIGRRWWNTNSTQFNDYTTADDQVKADYWGTTSNNALPEIYEWTKSNVHPSKWEKLVAGKNIVFGQLATGEAYVDNTLGSSNYHWVEEEDYVNGKTYTVYYFWVKNKKTIAQESKFARTYTVEQLSKVLLNPTAAGLAWWSPVGVDTILIKGIKPYLNNSSTVVQIKKKTQGEEKHQQWVFISEGNTVETIPEWLHVRLRDSISGHLFHEQTAFFTDYDPNKIYEKYNIVKYNNNFYVYTKNTQAVVAGAFNASNWSQLTGVVEASSVPGTWDMTPWGNIYDNDTQRILFYIEKNIPDTSNLHRYNRLGNTIRPYAQSWFNDLYEARRTFITRLNEIMLNVDTFEIPDWDSSILTNTAYTVGDQQVDMTAYWNFADYRSEDYDATKTIGKIINDISLLYNESYNEGEYIKINNALDPKKYSIYEKTATGGFNVVFRKGTAIQFKEEFETHGWDAAKWDNSTVWDYNTGSLFNGIVDAIRKDILVGKYTKYYSLIMCSMFRYILSEQINVDWLAKSSTIEPVNLIAQTLSNNDYVKRDEISVLTNFYSSVKAYRDKIRGGTINKVTVDALNVDITENLTTADITEAEYTATGGTEIVFPLRLSVDAPN